MARYTEPVMEKYEALLERAREGKWLAQLTRGEFAQLEEVYRKNFPEAPRMRYDCRSCQRELLKKIAGLFFGSAGGDHTKYQG